MSTVQSNITHTLRCVNPSVLHIKNPLVEQKYKPNKMYSTQNNTESQNDQSKEQYERNHLPSLTVGLLVFSSDFSVIKPSGAPHHTHTHTATRNSRSLEKQMYYL